MRPVLTAEEMRAADARQIAGGVPAAELMERAGRALAARVLEEGRGRRVRVFAGAGNNGGDGYVCARLLAEAGEDVAVIAAAEPRSEECRRARALFAGRVTENFEDADVAVDCLLGTGISRAPEGRMEEAIAFIARTGARVIACDVPSGLCATSGLAEGAAVRADVTVCIGQLKTGLFMNDGLDLSGKVVLEEIGIDPPAGAALLADADAARAAFPPRRRNTNKGSYGRAVIVGGSRTYPGAAQTAAAGLAALRAGCGYSALAVPESVYGALIGQVPECILLSLPGDDGMAFDGARLAEISARADAIAFGMGAGTGQGVRDSLRWLLENYGGNLIVDADGLNVLSEMGADALARAKCRVALTPHVKEFSRLAGVSVREILREGPALAREYARRCGAVVALKSASTFVTDGDRAVLSASGTSALAKGGSGDTLAGLAAGIAARRTGLFESVTAAVWLLGRSAEIVSAESGEYAPVAREIAAALPRAVAEISR